jgi:hypothetical protein
MGYNEQVIVKTLIYSSIFEYPLTKEELWQFAIAKKPLHQPSFFTAISESSMITHTKDFYSLKEEKGLVALRIAREKIAAKKLRIARRVSAILAKIPMILFIGISGSLSMANTKEEDDIDLFIITKQQSVWLTRVCILLMLELLGKRRKKYATKVNNTICINLLLEESHLQFSEDMHSLYTAHEVVQVKPLFNRDHTYEKFLAANVWVKKFMPNAVTVTPLYNDNLAENLYGITFLNFLAKKLQLWYMKRHRTSEIITDALVSFYTNKTEKHVLEAYKKKVTKYEI